jgi:hypothetical protein
MTARVFFDMRAYKIALEYLVEGLTYEELATKYGISRQRVGQIIISALAAAGHSDISTHDHRAQARGALHTAVMRSREPHLDGTPAWFYTHERGLSALCDIFKAYGH